jgi:hypothetical protein
VSGGTSYQWYRDGVKLEGATGATYQATQTGTYTADIITATCSGKASNSSVVSAGTSPTGQITPATGTLCGTGSTLSLSVSGGTSYQWYRDGVKLEGATAATYQATQTGTYTADIISGGCSGKASNQSSVISAGTSPTGQITPATGTLCGTGSTLSLSVSGGTSYQWYRDGVKLEGATAATYQATQTGTYTADIISGGCSGKASNQSSVISAGTSPTGQITPATGTLCGTGSTLSLSVSGGTSYQWYRDGVKLEGATAATYQATQAGTYTADIISGGCSGKASNQSSVISAGTSPTGQITPATGTLCGTGSTLSLSVSGGTSYQWYRDGVKIEGATCGYVSGHPGRNVYG